MDIKSLVHRLREIEVIKFGTFTLKSGLESPIYIDLRQIVSYPDVLQTVADLMWEQVQGAEFQRICGVPYTALPIATALSLKHQMPMLMRRKEQKDYGTKKLIEGSFNEGEKVLIVEDLVTSGGSVLETVAPLNEMGLEVKDVVVLLDREQGGEQNLEEKGLRLHSVLKMTQMLEVLHQDGIIDDETLEKIEVALGLQPAQ